MERKRRRRGPCLTLMLMKKFKDKQLWAMDEYLRLQGKGAEERQVIMRQQAPKALPYPRIIRRPAVQPDRLRMWWRGGREEMMACRWMKQGIYYNSDERSVDQVSIIQS